MFTTGIKTCFGKKNKIILKFDWSFLILLGLHPSTREEYYKRLFSEAKFYIFTDVQFSTLILSLMCFIIVTYFIKMARRNSKINQNDLKSFQDSDKHFSKKS